NRLIDVALGEHPGPLGPDVSDRQENITPHLALDVQIEVLRIGGSDVLLVGRASNARKRNESPWTKNACERPWRGWSDTDRRNGRRRVAQIERRRGVLDDGVIVPAVASSNYGAAIAGGAPGKSDPGRKIFIVRLVEAGPGIEPGSIQS